MSTQETLVSLALITAILDAISSLSNSHQARLSRSQETLDLAMPRANMESAVKWSPVERWRGIALSIIMNSLAWLVLRSNSGDETFRLLLAMILVANGVGAAVLWASRRNTHASAMGVLLATRQALALDDKPAEVPPSK